MKLALAAALCGLTALASGGAQAAATHFEGKLVIYGSGGTCTDYDPVGSRATVRFQPADVGTNGTESGFSYLFSSGGYNIRVTGPITSTFKTGTVTAIFDFGGPDGVADIRFSSQVPATITTSTETLNIVGSIKNFDGMIGCRADFRLGAVKIP